jgi:hypothetical protein
MLTGSFAAAYHGVPRATLDIDLVVHPSETQLRALVSSLESRGQYVSIEAALEALELESMFNVIDPSTGWKIDLIIRKSRAFSRIEFDRRVRIDFDETLLDVASLEDVVISKLEWAKLGASPRQITDVASLLQVRAADIDYEYLTQWVAAMGTEAQWDAARREAQLEAPET